MKIFTLKKIYIVIVKGKHIASLLTTFIILYIKKLEPHAKVTASPLLEFPSTSSHFTQIKVSVLQRASIVVRKGTKDSVQEIPQLFAAPFHFPRTNYTLQRIIIPLCIFFFPNTKSRKPTIPRPKYTNSLH